MTATRREFWCVDVFDDNLQRWMEWATWVDEPTAHAERSYALEQGYQQARVRRQALR